MTIPVFIGYDTTEHDAFLVCRDSILRRSTETPHIVKLDQYALRRNGWYDRSWRFAEEGQRIDELDGKPFSTDFSFTRFLVPALSLYQGWALYCDCDFLFTADLAGLFAKADPQYAVMVVKHEHRPRETKKMRGATQSAYRRKNWSSLVLWNCEHAAHRHLKPHSVNHSTGAWLHAFSWIPDEQIGALPATWNWLSGVDPAPEVGVPSGIHYTLGVPSMPGHETTPFGDLWLAERDSRRATGRPTPSERLRAFG